MAAIEVSTTEYGEVEPLAPQSWNMHRDLVVLRSQIHEYGIVGIEVPDQQTPAALVFDFFKTVFAENDHPTGTVRRETYVTLSRPDNEEAVSLFSSYRGLDAADLETRLAALIRYRQQQAVYRDLPTGTLSVSEYKIAGSDLVRKEMQYEATPQQKAQQKLMSDTLKQAPDRVGIVGVESFGAIFSKPGVALPAGRLAISAFDLHVSHTSYLPNERDDFDLPRKKTSGGSIYPYLGGPEREPTHIFIKGGRVTTMKDLTEFHRRLVAAS